MHAHAHLGIIGSHDADRGGHLQVDSDVHTERYSESASGEFASVVLLNRDSLGSFVTILLRSPWKLFFALIIVLALAVYGWEARAIVRARKRRTSDWGIRYFSDRSWIVDSTVAHGRGTFVAGPTA